MRMQKSYDASDAWGGAFGRMEEKREEKRAAGDRREEEAL